MLWWHAIIVPFDSSFERDRRRLRYLRFLIEQDLGKILLTARAPPQAKEAKAKYAGPRNGSCDKGAHSQQSNR